jgi:hypothetical protein
MANGKGASKKTLLERVNQLEQQVHDLLLVIRQHDIDLNSADHRLAAIEAQVLPS